ncbi:hypothetical protein EOPP23_19710 [Endozoicomonas sp. OPT23]|uniref:serine/threonine-protein kinase n=1 Tax=Endozoicomonas sp. OPT23 TaxID=2072845 RepID=UPI00129C00B3|nr:serine/threonine-protein kinase [Endozoicomonas sp. OPT23]MRI35198.1 hypothetical protein [Endozoicomonas sp. OPT23]
MAVESTGSISVASQPTPTSTEKACSEEGITGHSKRKVTKFSPLSLIKTAYQQAQPKLKALTSRKVEIIEPLPRQTDARAILPDYQAGKVKSAPSLTALTQGKTLGEGAFGTVYQAQESVVESKQSLREKFRSMLRIKSKISSPQQLGKHYVVKRQALTGTEADKAAQIKSISSENTIQNIAPGALPVTASKVSADGKFHETMMEHGGGSLSSVMGEFTERGDRKEGALPAEQTIDLSRQLVSQLRDIHAAGVIHRDIKAENVLVNNQGKAALVDYGNAAHTTNEDPSTARLRGTAGSAIYMAPEMIEGKKYGQKADVWSMGMLLAEMATGKEPPVPDMKVNPDGKTLKKISVNEKNLARFKLLVSKNRNLSPEFKSLIKGMLERDPDKRLSAKQAAAHPYFSGTDTKTMSSVQLQSKHNQLYSQLAKAEQALFEARKSGADISALRESVTSLGNQMKELQTLINTKNIESQINTLDNRKDQIEERLFELRQQRQTRSVKKEIKTLDQQLPRIELNITALQSELQTPEQKK